MLDLENATDVSSRLLLRILVGRFSQQLLRSLKHATSRWR